MHQCSRCGRRYPTTLEVSEIRKADGTMETVCKHCQGTSRCEICGYTSRDRKNFAVRKLTGKWRVLCTKCLKKEEGGN